LRAHPEGKDVSKKADEAFDRSLSNLSMGSACAKRSHCVDALADACEHCHANRLADAFYAPSSEGWEGAEVFKKGWEQDGVVWWGTWSWKGWAA
jgi:hypothetical protein